MGKKFLLSAFTLIVFPGCTQQMEIPEGYWVSSMGKPSILITVEGNNKYTATVYHILSDSSLCPINYPIVRNSVGAYIQAEGRILISYSPEESILFLSPGGEYYRPIEAGMK